MMNPSSQTSRLDSARSRLERDPTFVQKMISSQPMSYRTDEVLIFNHVQNSYRRSREAKFTEFGLICPEV